MDYENLSKEEKKQYLIEKLRVEFDDFCGKLTDNDAATQKAIMINFADEIATKREIIGVFENDIIDISEEQIDFLCSLDNTLHSIYYVYTYDCYASPELICNCVNDITKKGDSLNKQSEISDDIIMDMSQVAAIKGEKNRKFDERKAFIYAVSHIGGVTTAKNDEDNSIKLLAPDYNNSNMLTVIGTYEDGCLFITNDPQYCEQNYRITQCYNNIRNGCRLYNNAQSFPETEGFDSIRKRGYKAALIVNDYVLGVKYNNKEDLFQYASWCIDGGGGELATARGVSSGNYYYQKTPYHEVMDMFNNRASVVSTDKILTFEELSEIVHSDVCLSMNLMNKLNLRYDLDMYHKMNSFGYHYSGMYPISDDDAKKYVEACGYDNPLFALFSDGTEIAVKSQEQFVDCLDNGAMFAIDEEMDFETFKANYLDNNDIDDSRWQDSGNSLR